MICSKLLAIEEDSQASHDHVNDPEIDLIEQSGILPFTPHNKTNLQFKMCLI
jgi:hypothetical protein